MSKVLKGLTNRLIKASKSESLKFSKEDLKNSTTVSKLVVKILLFVPVFLILIIYFLNPEYFKPFFASPLGYFLLAIILIMFSIYAYILGKIVKVEYWWLKKIL